MNKKGVFLAIFSLFIVLGLTAVYLVIDKGTGEIVKMYFKPTDVLIQNFEVKEYIYNLNQGIKYDSFKAFEHFCEGSGLKANSKCEAWYEEDCNIENLAENFKSYFGKPNYNVDVKVENDKFVISYVYEGEMIFGQYNIKTKLQPKASYILDYDVSKIKELYNNCRDVVSCDNLGDCEIDKDKCDDSSRDNYINMEFDFKDNGFIQPKLKFSLKTEGL